MANAEYARKREKLSLRCPVAVEGKYDKIKLDAIVETPILVLNGFSVFHDREKLDMLRAVIAKTGLILLTDSDRAGSFLRSRLKGLLPEDRSSGKDEGRIYQVYAPPLKGKEKRKSAPSADGLLGVEGTDADILYDLLLPFSREKTSVDPVRAVTKAEWYADGFTGKQDSSARRRELARALSLPETLTGNALLEALNLLGARDKYEEFKSCHNHASES